MPRLLTIWLDLGENFALQASYVPIYKQQGREADDETSGFRGVSAEDHQGDRFCKEDFAYVSSKFPRRTVVWS